jgi:hypothetical protein
VGVCVPNTSSVVKTGLVLNGLNMSSFNSTAQLKQVIVGAVVAALGVDASSVFVDSIGEITDAANGTSSTRRQLASSGISAVIRIVTDASQADAIGASLAQKVSDGALLESMATEAASMGLGDALSATLREATVELTTPPTVTGENGVPRLAEPPTTSPTPAPEVEERGGGLYVIVLPVIGGLLLVLVLVWLYVNFGRHPKGGLDTEGKKPAKKKQSVAMIVPTAGDTQRQLPPLNPARSILSPPSWTEHEERKEEEGEDGAGEGRIRFRPDLQDCGRFPPVSTFRRGRVDSLPPIDALPDLPDLPEVPPGVVQPSLPPVLPKRLRLQVQQVVPALPPALPPAEEEARMRNHTTSRYTTRFANPAMGEDEDDEDSPDSPDAVLGPPKWLLAQISDEEEPWS